MNFVNPLHTLIMGHIFRTLAILFAMSTDVEFQEESQVNIPAEQTSWLVHLACKLPFIANKSQANLLLVIVALLFLFTAALTTAVLLYKPEVSVYDGAYVTPADV